MLKNLINIFFPDICEACKLPLGTNEKIICTSCRHELPVTDFHFENNNAVKKVFYGRVQLENATALLHFSKKGLVQELLHNLKYRGHERIGTCLGEWLGAELCTLESYKSVDVVVPVPIHKKKRRERGYNQVTKFGKAIAKALDSEYREDTLVKVERSKTQVFKDRITRFDDSKPKFAQNNFTDLKGKHVLLVDDIITTGATIETCVLLLQKIPDVQISLAVMALTE